MAINWSVLLPPYNFARLFSYTRALETECDEWKQRAKEWQNYALVVRGLPSVSVVSEPRVSRPGPAPRPSINGLRRKAQRVWAVRAEDELNGDSMAQAADEYAASLKGNTN